MEQGFPVESPKDPEVSVRPLSPFVQSGSKRHLRSLVALDALNFFQADVHGGVGPFLVTFLATTLRWTPDRIGMVMFASGILGLCAQASLWRTGRSTEAEAADSCRIRSADCAGLHRDCSVAKFSGYSGWPIFHRASRSMFQSGDRSDFHRFGWPRWDKLPDWLERVCQFRRKRSYGCCRRLNRLPNRQLCHLHFCGRYVSSHDRFGDVDSGG